MEPKKDCQKAGSLDLGGASSGATTPNSGEISARSARRWLSWPFGKSHRCNLQLQSSQTRLEVKEDAGIKEVPTQEQVASRCPLKETAASTEPSKEDGDGGLEPNLSRRGRPALLIHKLKKAFVVWARQKIKAKKASNLKSKRRMKKTIKGKRLKTQTCPDSAGVKAKDEISREAAASYIRNAFERFQKLGASPNAAAANALREMAGLAPVLKAKARTSVPQMLLPPVSWGAFEPATCSDDAETEAIEETLNETILDTQSTQLDPETQDANGDEEDTAVTMKRPSPEPAGVPAEDLLPTAQPDEEKKVKPEAKPQKRRSKANAQKPSNFIAGRMAGRSEDQSQSSNVLLYVMVAIYVFLLMMVAKIAHSRKKRVAADEGEVKAHFGGSFGAFTLFLTTFSTVYSGFTVTGIPNEAFSKGFVSVRWVGATLVIVAGMLLLYPRLRRLAVERQYESPMDFITDRYGSGRLRVLSACCGIIPMVIYITAQMISFAAMVEGMTLQLIPKYVSMIIFCVLILTLEVLGGMNSVVLTDVVQCIVMIASFLVVGGVLAAEYGSIPEIGPADCSFLESVSKNATDAYSVPAPCVGSNCVAAGCIAAVNPEFYQFPSRSTLCDIIFFLINMLAAPLQPHMVQRAYIASSDANLRIVMAAMLLAPFVAQPPGIVIGLTKSAYNPSWPLVDQEATAFSGLTSQLKMTGPFQYFLVTLMTCSCLAAIMSTADSALMGASSIVSLDIFKKTLCPSMSKKSVVRIGELNSVLVCGLAFLLGMFLSDDQMGVIIIFQNGMLMQLLPAFGFGLYLQVSERPVCAGILAGLISLVILTITGNPLDGYVPPVNISVFVNFLVVGLMSLVAPGTGEAAKLDVAQIRTVMATSREPKLVLVALMVGIALISTPWYAAAGSLDSMIWGAPRWAIIQLLSFVAIFLLGLLAALLWQPPKDPKASASTEKVTGVAPSEAETASTEEAGKV